MELFGEKLKTLDKVCGKLISRKIETNLRKLRSQLKSIGTRIVDKSKNSRKYNYQSSSSKKKIIIIIDE